MNDESRQLAAITFIDIVDFSKLMHSSEKEAMNLLSLQKDVVYPIIKNYQGIILKELGDGLLISFDSAIQAVNCSSEIQSKVEYINNLNYRIGIHIGDIIKKDGDIFGDGVNIASRIESFSESGGICISKTVFDALQNQSGFHCVTLGKKTLKGISEKIELFKIDTNLKSKIKDISANTTSHDYKIKGNKWFLYLSLPLVCLIIIIAGIYNKNNFIIGEADFLSVAILPFGNTIGDEDFEWLRQQFVDELTNKLLNLEYFTIKDFSQVSNVIQSIEPSKANLIDLAIAQKLGEAMSTTYIIYGNYLIFNKEQIRITSNLANVKTGAIVISFQETYEISNLMEILDIFPTSFKNKINEIDLGIIKNDKK